MSEWTIRDAVAEDEACLVSMWLKSYAHSRDVRESGLESASVDGHPHEIRFWKIHQPIVTSLIRGGTVKVACDPERADYTRGPAVIAGWACITPEHVHWVGVKRSVMKIEGGAAELVTELLGAALEAPLRMTFDLMDLRRIGMHPEAWKRDRGWLAGLRSLSTRLLDKDATYTTVGQYLLDTRREEWRQNSERAA